MIKGVITLLFFLHASLVWGQVPEMSITNSTLLRAIDIFLDSVASHKLQSKQFVIAAHISKLEVFSTTTIWLRDTLKSFPLEEQLSYELALLGSSSPRIYIGIPQGKFHYRGREVYMFFGVNHFAEYLEKDRKKLMKREFRKYPSSDNIGVLFCQIEDKKIHVLAFIRLVGEK